MSSNYKKRSFLPTPIDALKIQTSFGVQVLLRSTKQLSVKEMSSIAISPCQFIPRAATIKISKFLFAPMLRVYFFQAFPCDVNQNNTGKVVLYTA